jgi:hypothetical protein
MGQFKLECRAMIEGPNRHRWIPAFAGMTRKARGAIA